MLILAGYLCGWGVSAALLYPDRLKVARYVYKLDEPRDHRSAVMTSAFYGLMWPMLLVFIAIERACRAAGKLFGPQPERST